MHGTSALSLDWLDMAAFKRSFTDPVPAKREAFFRAEDIDAFHGAARFVAPNAVEVGAERLETRHVLIAAGAEPARLPFDGAEHLTTSDQFFELGAFPKEMILVGGGYIGFEFAHLAARMGSKAVILQRGQRCLPHFEPDLVQRLIEKSRRLGIKVHVGSEVIAVARTTDGGVAVDARMSDSSIRRFSATVAIHAAGRVPAIAGLNLEAGGVETDGGSLRLNKFLQSTSNPAVYAAGDAAARGPALTPVAAHDAEVVAVNLLHGSPHREPDYTGVPSVAFTIPAITSVGLAEEAARKQGLRFTSNHHDMTEWQAVRHVQEDTAAYKVLIEDGTHRILGAHILGPDAEHTINIFAMAMRLGLTARDMGRFMSAFPTAASNVFHMIAQHAATAPRPRDQFGGISESRGAKGTL